MNSNEWSNLIDRMVEGGYTEVDEEVLKEIRFQDTRILIALAQQLGWDIEISSRKRALIITSHDGQKMEVGGAKLTMKVFRAHVRTLIRHSVNQGDNLPMGILMENIIAGYVVDDAHAQVLRHFAAEVKPVASISAPQQAQESVSFPDNGGTSETEPAPVSVGGRRRRRITKQEPWSAHKGSTKDGLSTTYPSQAVMERLWSDGVTDYACRWTGCPYTHETPHSVSSHYASHRRGQGTQPQPPVDGVDPDHTPQKSARIRRLRMEIDGAFAAALAEGVDFSVVDQAEWLAAWIINHRVEPLHAGTDEDPKEYTAEEALDKIAAIADRGRSPILREQIDSLSAAVEGYMDRVDELAAQREAAEARADRAEENLETLGELVQEITSKLHEAKS